MLSDVNKGGIDCGLNTVQGYWKLRAFYDCVWVAKVYMEDRVWQGKEKLLETWIFKGLTVWALCCALVPLRVYVPIAVYCIYGFLVAWLLYINLMWVISVVKNSTSPAQWWCDVTVERTYPGSVRYFSIDYASMVWAYYLWLIFDTTGA